MNAKFSVTKADFLKMLAKTESNIQAEVDNEKLGPKSLIEQPGFDQVQKYKLQMLEGLLLHAQDAIKEAEYAIDGSVEITISV